MVGVIQNVAVFVQKAPGFEQKAAVSKSFHSVEHLFQAVETFFWRRQTVGIEALFNSSVGSSASSSAASSAGSEQMYGLQPTVCQPVKHQVQEVQDISDFTILP